MTWYQPKEICNTGYYFGHDFTKICYSYLAVSYKNVEQASHLQAENIDLSNLVSKLNS